jgi:hypothetical protein
MGIKIVDIGAPAVVIGVDMITLETVPQYNEISSYALTGIGYGVALLGLGREKTQDFFLKIGMSSLALTARAVRERVKAGAPLGAKTSRYALRAGSQIRQSVLPEFADVRIS